MTVLTFLKSNARWLGAGAVMTFLSSFGQTYFISLFAAPIMLEFSLSHGDWGNIYTLGTGASALVMLWAGALTDRHRTRVLGAGVLALLAGACLMMALNPWAALLPVVIFALRFCGQGMMSHVAMVSMSRWFVATRGRALSVAGLGFAAGEALLPVLVVSLMLVLDWHWLWVAAAGACLVAIPLLSALLREERTPQSHAETDHAFGMGARHWSRGQMLRHPLFWFMVPALLGPAAFNTAFFFWQSHFAEVKGITHFSLTTLFPLYTACGIGAMLLSGWLLDKFGTPRLIPWFQLPMVAGFALFALAPGLIGVGLGLVCVAMTAGANSTLPNAFWAEFYGTGHLGSVKALATAVMVLGSALGPGITGNLIDAGIGIETQYLGIAGYFVLTTLFMAIGVRRSAPALAPAL